ncbi:MAG: hypothetical protein RMI80_10430 [Meiothermus sp.]|uniref:hypothetical protein n=1 Tax=Meiothermus sp. TaxID=1955249 RepID=UPI00298F0B04|nr:hypothetical protein [Meiothermus sp.]MDW8091814.1 hypothetical protein [Meiothermus sp.]
MEKAKEVRLWKWNEEGTKRTLVYQGPIEQAPEPARTYWREITKLYGQGAWEYFRYKAPPMGLLARGYTLEPLEDALYWEKVIEEAAAERRARQAN